MVWVLIDRKMLRLPGRALPDLRRPGRYRVRGATVTGLASQNSQLGVRSSGRCPQAAAAAMPAALSLRPRRAGRRMLLSPCPARVPARVRRLQLVGWCSLSQHGRVTGYAMMSRRVTLTVPTQTVTSSDHTES
jgi:hypothetical protein